MPPPEQYLSQTEIKLTPVDLFKGEAAKFRSFLGDMSGAFKLSYKGKRPNARLDIDIWRNGRKADTVGSLNDVFFHLDNGSSDEIEIILSIDKVSIGQEEASTIKVGTVHGSGTGLATFTIPWDKKLTARGLIAYLEPRSFTADKAVYVWGMHATSTNVIETADFTPESMSRLEWALIFTLRFED